MSTRVTQKPYIRQRDHPPSFITTMDLQQLCPSCRAMILANGIPLRGIEQLDIIDEEFDKEVNEVKEYLVNIVKEPTKKRRRSTVSYEELSCSDAEYDSDYELGK